ncbi:MAG: hypothetical protein JWR21_19 [Herminiimonas sp.]|nr:hypothetical protein [Herminiimonas sp.]
MANTTTSGNDVWDMISMLADSLTAIAHVINKTEEAMANNPAQEGVNTGLRIELLEAKQALLLATLREIRAACVRAHIDSSKILAKIEGN